MNNLLRMLFGQQSERVNFVRQLVGLYLLTFMLSIFGNFFNVVEKIDSFASNASFFEHFGDKYDQEIADNELLTVNGNPVSKLSSKSTANRISALKENANLVSSQPNQELIAVGEKVLSSDIPNNRIQYKSTKDEFIGIGQISVSDDFNKPSINAREINVARVTSAGILSRAQSQINTTINTVGSIKAQIQNNTTGSEFSLSGFSTERNITRDNSEDTIVHSQQVIYNSINSNNPSIQANLNSTLQNGFTQSQELTGNVTRLEPIAPGSLSDPINCPDVERYFPTSVARSGARAIQLAKGCS